MRARVQFPEEAVTDTQTWSTTVAAAAVVGGVVAATRPPSATALSELPPDHVIDL